MGAKPAQRHVSRAQTSFCLRWLTTKLRGQIFQLTGSSRARSCFSPPPLTSLRLKLLTISCFVARSLASVCLGRMHNLLDTVSERLASPHHREFPLPPAHAPHPSKHPSHPKPRGGDDDTPSL
ncbi:uncharacterized protein RHTO_02193 [Rhodotorula toruloides NP11]|uniref:Uncharacterized protein n=1 Tax=Rhodotorula toruloides (strain NP11) TaxID=1130832 RepID=M7XL91_RHOT1|nr:uncharacterized protein RHTO_02193 [Rhodotorula toruloides NP11]EMS20933.1 hypothetical protein RHTO_02193 [Rhodotorula toruloides NP11]